MKFGTCFSNTVAFCIVAISSPVIAGGVTQETAPTSIATPTIPEAHASNQTEVCLSRPNGTVPIAESEPEKMRLLWGSIGGGWVQNLGSPHNYSRIGTTDGLPFLDLSIGGELHPNVMVSLAFQTFSDDEKRLTLEAGGAGDVTFDRSEHRLDFQAIAGSKLNENVWIGVGLGVAKDRLLLETRSNVDDREDESWKTVLIPQVVVMLGNPGQHFGLLGRIRYFDRPMAVPILGGDYTIRRLEFSLSPAGYNEF